MRWHGPATAYAGTALVIRTERISSTVVDPRLERIGAAIDAELPLELMDPKPFVELERPPRLGRFSRYWRDAEAVVWDGYSPSC